MRLIRKTLNMRIFEFKYLNILMESNMIHTHSIPPSCIQ